MATETDAEENLSALNSGRETWCLLAHCTKFDSKKRNWVVLSLPGSCWKMAQVMVVIPLELMVVISLEKACCPNKLLQEKSSSPLRD